MRNKEDLLADVVEGFLFHSQKAQSDIPIVRDIAKKMCDIEICEMWMLTQAAKKANKRLEV